MLLISCPWCGPRDENEFTCGGESHVVRPALSADDVTWGTYLYTRRNPKGITFERWRHTYGCCQWFNIARHTVTHEIKAIYRFDEPKPDFSDEAAP